MTHKIVAVTPAGRRAYLEILKSYILADDSIVEWHLWDNCRQESDRLYIQDLQRQYPKIRIIQVEKVDGSNRAINQFYRQARDSDTFYIKMDDDLVYLPPGFGRAFYEVARAERGQFTYWSPLVVNNAICSWLLKYHSGMHIGTDLSASAACGIGWRSPRFALRLHEAFLKACAEDRLDLFKVPRFNVALSRFSINCIGFFGEDAARWGEIFCPLNVDDEEWLSAVLPSKTGLPGRIVGELTVAHFSFYTQEADLLAANALDGYFRLAGVTPVPLPAPRKRTLLEKLRRIKHFLEGGPPDYLIAPRAPGTAEPASRPAVA